MARIASLKGFKMAPTARLMPSRADLPLANQKQPAGPKSKV
jgi:hypothetical protein